MWSAGGSVPLFSFNNSVFLNWFELWLSEVLIANARKTSSCETKGSCSLQEEHLDYPGAVSESGKLHMLIKDTRYQKMEMVQN